MHTLPAVCKDAGGGSRLQPGRGPSPSCDLGFQPPELLFIGPSVHGMGQSSPNGLRRGCLAWGGSPPGPLIPSHSTDDSTTPVSHTATESEGGGGSYGAHPQSLLNFTLNTSTSWQREREEQSLQAQVQRGTLTTAGPTAWRGGPWGEAGRRVAQETQPLACFLDRPARVPADALE